MGPTIKQECFEIDHSQPKRNHDTQDGDSSSSDYRSDDETAEQTSGQQQSKRGIHVSVHREDISAAQVQEGSEELQGLGVDVYDQQTYERSVFDQVDKAISGPRDASDVDNEVCSKTDQHNPSSMGDLMRLIHDGDHTGKAPSDETSTQPRDEEILQLARQQRLNITRLKSEPFSKFDKLPRISRISKDTGETTPGQPMASTSAGIQSATSSLKRERVEPELPSFLDDDLEDEISSISGAESCTSEYLPGKVVISDDSFDDANEDIDYVTDSDADKDDLLDSLPDAQKDSKRKRLKDDGDFKAYAARIKSYNKLRAQARLENIDSNGVECKSIDELIKIDGNLMIPKDIWENLYEHQRTGIRWLWEIHQLGTGGILGDEMGLGKTIQMIAFLVALRNSNLVNILNGYRNLGPVILVCPATVMHQWLQELRKWYPPFRVAILHSTGTYSGDRKQLVKVIHKSNGILICSYPGVIIYQDYLHALDWHYAILDEGHKIKNPDSQVTLACKRFRTPHRIILSGSPVQNNLRELWSIFDFIYPGKLGTLNVFLSQFAIPITQGGYANATDMQVQIAYRCACVLRDTIKPFLLRRTKAEVSNKLKLPQRSEQVLFCKLTDKQRKLYQHFLDSPTVRDIKRGALQIFVGLIQLRKICNHPDIFDASECNRTKPTTRRSEKDLLVEETYGHYQKSGKMMVVDALLKLWKKQSDKVLLFTQSRQMLKIFARYLNERQFKHLTMDGSTPIGIRHSLIDEFNSDPDIFVFLLTTRVGGVGVNLIGANRIIIYDPDWNPSTDIQARERAWRIGQQRHVIIYRLLTAGTIEEKIYHRQVFKLYLTNRILKDAKQKRFFKTNDLHELFALGSDDKNIETKALFDDDLQIDEKSIKRSKKRDKRNKRRKLSKADSDENDSPAKSKLTDARLKELREQAKRLSKLVALKYGAHNQTAGQSVAQQNIDLTSGGQTPPNVDYAEGPSRSCDGIPGLEPLQLIADDVPDTMGVYNDSSRNDTVKSVAYSPSVESFASSSRQTKPTSSKKHLVDFLVKQDIYRPEGVGGSKKNDSRHERDDYILGRLFKNSNISGALKHDRIESDATADFKIVESEAEKVARDAIRALRDSRRLCMGFNSGVPNWTGRGGQVITSQGSTNRRLLPTNRARVRQLATNGVGSPSAASGNGESILEAIRKRNQSNPIDLRTSQNGDRHSEDEEADLDFRGRAAEAGADEIADKIRSFIVFHSASCGEAQTDELLDFFKRTFRPEQTAVFKAILYKMCEFQRRGGSGFWKIRSEFRSI